MENNKHILITNFCIHHGVEVEFVFSLKKFGLIAIYELEEEHYLAIDELSKVEKMVSMHHDLGINIEGIDAVFILLKQIEQLQDELVIVKNRLAALAPD